MKREIIELKPDIYEINLLNHKEKLIEEIESIEQIIETSNYNIYRLIGKNEKYTLKILKQKTNKKVILKEFEVREKFPNISTSSIFYFGDNFIIEEYIEHDLSKKITEDEVYHQFLKIHEDISNKKFQHITNIISEMKLMLEKNRNNINNETYKNLIILIKDIKNKTNNTSLVHGDLHNNNLMFDIKSNKIKIIDFGQSYIGDIEIDYYIRYIYTKNEYWLNKISSIDKINLFHLTTTVGDLLKNKKYSTINTMFSSSKITFNLDISSLRKISKLIKESKYIIINNENYNLDKLTIKILQKEFEKKEIISKIINKEIIFKEFKIEEIKQILSPELFIMYIRNNSILVNKKKNTRKKKFELFEEYKTILHFDKYFSITKFQYPKEEEKERFFYYFGLTNKNELNCAIKLLDKLHFNCKKLFVESYKYKIISHYTIGFVYQKNKLIRKTIYLYFLPEFNLEKYIKFYKENISENIRIVDIIGIDYYDKYITTKYYNYNHNFNLEINDKKLQKIFYLKNCILVDIEKKNKYSEKKYEFTLTTFTKEEKKYLKEIKLFIDNNDSFSVYFDKDGEIKKKVLYYV